MAYTYRIFDSIADASNEDWERCFRAMPTVFMDRKFLLTVEKTLGNESKFWHVIFYDTDLDPVAWTSLCTFRVDLTTVASSAVKRIFEVGRCVLPSLARIKILFAVCRCQSVKNISSLLLLPIRGSSCSFLIRYSTSWR